MCSNTVSPAQWLFYQRIAERHLYKFPNISSPPVQQLTPHGFFIFCLLNEQKQLMTKQPTTNQQYLEEIFSGAIGCFVYLSCLEEKRVFDCCVLLSSSSLSFDTDFASKTCLRRFFPIRLPLIFEINIPGWLRENKRILKKRNRKSCTPETTLKKQHNNKQLYQGQFRAFCRTSFTIMCATKRWVKTQFNAASNKKSNEKSNAITMVNRMLVPSRSSVR